MQETDAALEELLETWRQKELVDAGGHDRDGALPDEVRSAAAAVGLDDVVVDDAAARLAARVIGRTGLGHAVALVVAPAAAARAGVATGRPLVLGGVALGGSLATAPEQPGWLGLRVASPRSGTDGEADATVDDLLLQSLAGLAPRLAELATTHASTREAFGRPLRSFQVMAHRLVDIQADVAAITTLADQGVVATHRRSLLAALRHAWSLVDSVLQVHGGLGYAEELEVARHWRDIRMLRLLVEPPPPAVEVDPPAPQPRHAREDAPATAALRARAADFVAEHIAPHVTAWELATDWPRELFVRAGEAGLLSHRFPASVGGGDGGIVTQAAWVEELARCGAGGLAADLGASIDLAAVYVHAAGTTEQHERWLRPLLAGEAVGALAITEPGTGSDVAGITTRARRDGDDWLLTGAKVFITNGPWADVVVVAAKVAPEDGGGATPHGQVTLFAVPGDAAGLSRRRLSMLGWRTSHTGELTFDDVRVGDDHRLGDVGSGFGWIVRNFAWERMTLALAGIVAAETAMDSVPADRRDGRWAELDAAVVAGRAITDDALARTIAVPNDPATLRAVAIAKLRTQRLAVDAADLALSVVGVDGARMDHPAQRWLRDTRLGPIGGGTDTIMREIVAKLLP